MTIKINEIFGPTIQGEGLSTGKHCMFIRVSRCNLHCSWCDTPYTWAHTEAKAEKHNTEHMWDASAEEHELNIIEILQQLRAKWDFVEHPTLIVISGGEPMLQQKQLDPLIDQLHSFGCDVEVETAGTIAPVVSWCRETRFNVSPKLEHSGNELRARRNPKALKALAKLDSTFKFVVSDASQFDEVKLIVALAGIPRDRVWIMPEGITAETVRKNGLAIVDEVMVNGWNLSLRNHITLWEEERAK